jgi:hypothetical protein
MIASPANALRPEREGGREGGRGRRKERKSG